MIWKSNAFWTVVVDLVVSAALYFGGKYAGPAVFEDIKWGIGALQIVAAMLIAHFATETVKAEVAHLRKLSN